MVKTGWSECSQALDSDGGGGVQEIEAATFTANSGAREGDQEQVKGPHSLERGTFPVLCVFAGKLPHLGERNTGLRDQLLQAFKGVVTLTPGCPVSFNPVEFWMKLRKVDDGMTGCGVRHDS